MFFFAEVRRATVRTFDHWVLSSCWGQLFLGFNNNIQLLHVFINLDNIPKMIGGGVK